MAIFGLFGKKDGQPAPVPGEKEPSRIKSGEGPARPGPKNEADRSKQAQRNVARADTAKKIDAIESEMSSEFIPPPKSGGRPANAKTTASKPQDKGQNTETFGSTLPGMTVSTEFLLGEEGKTGAIEVASSGASQVIEEAAILYANDQKQMVEQMLQSTIHDNTVEGRDRTAWWMLFDLYQMTGNRQQFDHLSIEYASKFESSPPSWIESNQASGQAAPVARGGATPTVPFTGKLDANIIKLLERIQKLAQNNRTLRLEFVRVTEVDPIGCGLLLRALKKLQSAEFDLILVGAPELAAKIRAILQVGRRDETEAPWLLLLEILRLLNSEKEFEETSIDYCITFEVSPPAFVAPKKVTTAMEEMSAVNTSADTFSMPTVIEGGTEQLIGAIAAFAEQHSPAILDCSRLHRVDFSSAGQLLSGFAPLSASGKTIELHHVNHLVAALFLVLGLHEIVRVIPRKF